MIVVDASVLVTALVDDGHDGTKARTALTDDALLAPDIIDLEVLSVLRRMSHAGSLDPVRASEAVEDLRHFPLTRVSHVALTTRCWELRENLTPYDAVYVALAEVMGATLLTGDRRLAAAPGIRCTAALL